MIITLRNIRCFEHRTIDISPNWVEIRGTGKTTQLQAIALALSPWRALAGWLGPRPHSFVRAGCAQGEVMTPEAVILISRADGRRDVPHCMGVLPDCFAMAYGVSRRSGAGIFGPSPETWADSLFHGGDLVNIQDWLCRQRVEDDYQDRYRHIIDGLSRIVGQQFKTQGSRLLVLDDKAGWIEYGKGTSDTLHYTLCWVVDVLARWLQAYPASAPNFMHTMDPTVLVDGFDLTPMWCLADRLRQIMPNTKFIVSVIGG